jgi:serine/threonine protein kinase
MIYIRLKKFISYSLITAVLSFHSLLLATTPSTGFVSNDTVTSSSNHYTVVKELGRGAFGTVFLAEDDTQQILALKRWPGDTQAAKIEYTLGTRYDHPNLIKAYEHFLARDDIGYQWSYVVLECADGKTLNDTSFSQQEEAMSCVHQLITALEYLLEEQMIHDDLHGGNIIIDKEQQVKLIDLSSIKSVGAEDAVAEKAVTRNHNAYYQALIHIITEVLHKSPLDKQIISQFHRGAQDILLQHYAATQDQPLTIESPQFFKAYLNDIVTLLAELTTNTSCGQAN